LLQNVILSVSASSEDIITILPEYSV